MYVSFKTSDAGRYHNKVVEVEEEQFQLCIILLLQSSIAFQRQAKEDE